MYSLFELGKALWEGRLGRLGRIERIRAKAMLTGEDLLGGEDLEALRFDFEHGTLCFVCRGESDALELSDVPDDWQTPYITDLSNDDAWRGLIGRELFAVWQVVTPTADPDGFQMEFGPAEDTRRIQVDGAASMIRRFDVTMTTAQRSAASDDSRG